MLQPQCRFGYLAVVLTALASSAATQAAEIPKEVDKFFKDYVAVFDGGDAAKLAAMWTSDAEWTNGITGERSIGREAVEADFAKFFADNPGAQLTGDVQHAKQLAPGVIRIEGLATVTTAGNDPVVSEFNAVLVQQDGKWLLSDIREGAPVVPDSPYAKLKDLEFLIGDWQDDGGDASVQTTFRWAADGAFLVRSYTVDRAGEMTKGTQVFGWDPRENRMRSWNFVSDGSFGEGVWSASGDEWVGRMGQTLADGGSASGTQIIRRIDNDTLEVETVGREINGELQPSAPPVRVVRVATDAAPTDSTTTEAAAAQGGQQ